MNAIALAAAAFNLVCAGTQTADSIAGQDTKAYEATYRLNLDEKKWCEGECKARQDIASIQPAELRLQDEHKDTPSERSMLLNAINRETGAQAITATYANPHDRRSTITMKWEGTCAKATFTGFPDVATKF